MLAHLQPCVCIRECECVCVCVCVCVCEMGGGGGDIYNRQEAKFLGYVGFSCFSALWVAIQLVQQSSTIR